MCGGSSSDDDQCSKTRKSSPVKMQISVLVVDDDPVALAIVSAMLRAEMHQAFTAKDPIEALSMLRQHQGSIDLVIADYHMPQMNGSELQRKIDTEFKLPVVNDNQSTAVESLMNGAVFFMEKPVKPDDLKNIWQYVVAARKRKSVSISVSVPNEDAELSPQDDEDHPNNYNNRNSAAAANKRGRIINGADNCDTNTTYTHRDHPDHAQDDGCSSAPKKPKVVWTNSLHNRFLQAIRYIGLEKAVPKKILEVMNVPGLTRPNVASHLQKYREFLRRIASKGVNKERFLKSSFASGHRFSIASGADHQSVSGPLSTPGYFSATQFAPSQYYGTNYNYFNNAAAAAANNWNPLGQQPPQFYASTGSVATAPTTLGLVMNNSANFGSTLNMDPFSETPQAAAGAGRRGVLTTSSMAPYSNSNNNYDGIGTGDYPHAPFTSNFMGSQYSANVYNINNGGLMSSTTGGGCGGGGQYYSESSSAINNGNMVFGNDQFLGFGLNTDATGDELDEVDYGIMSDDSFAMDNMFIIQQMARLTVEDNANFADQFINSKMAPSTPQMLGGGGFPNPNLETTSNYGGQDQIFMDQPENYPDLQFMSLLLSNDKGHHSWDGQMLGQVGTQQLVTNSTAGAIVIPSILESGACPTISEASYNMFGYNQKTNYEQGNYGQAPNSTQHGINSTPNEAITSSAGNQQVYNFYDDDEWDEELLEAFFRTDDDA